MLREVSLFCTSKIRSDSDIKACVFYSARLHKHLINGAIALQILLGALTTGLAGAVKTVKQASLMATSLNWHCRRIDPKGYVIGTNLDIHFGSVWSAFYVTDGFTFCRRRSCHACCLLLGPRARFWRARIFHHAKEGSRSVIPGCSRVQHGSWP